MARLCLVGVQSEKKQKSNMDSQTDSSIPFLGSKHSYWSTVTLDNFYLPPVLQAHMLFRDIDTIVSSFGNYVRPSCTYIYDHHTSNTHISI